MTTENQNVQDLTRAIKELTNKIAGNGNSSASVVGISGKYGGNGNSDNFGTTVDKTTDSMERLAKASKDAASSVGDEMKERQRDARAGFSDIVKRLGGSVINSMPFRTNKKILQQGIKNLDAELSKASSSVRDGLGKILRESAKANELHVGGFLKSTDGMIDQFKILDSVSKKLGETTKVSLIEAKAFVASVKKMEASGFKVVDVMGGTTSAFGKLNGIMKDLAGGLKSKGRLDDIKAASDAIKNAGNLFADSALTFADTIDTGLKDKFEALGKSADKAGENLKMSLKVAIPAALLLEGAGLIGATKAGFRGTDATSAASTGMMYGQSMASLAEALKSNRQALQLGFNSPDLMAAAESGLILPLYNEIRDTFSLIGAENTKFMGDSMNTLMTLGIKPTTEASKEFRDIIQTMGSMDNKGPQEVLDVFANMAKDKGFKAFFHSMNTGGKGLKNLFKSFSKIHTEVGLTIDEFVSMQHEFAAKRGQDGIESIVQGVFAGKLATRLGFNDEKAALLREGEMGVEGLSPKRREDYIALSAIQRGALTEEITRIRAIGGMEGKILLKQLQVLTSRAGGAGKEMVEVANALSSGKQGFNAKYIGEVLSIGNRATKSSELLLVRIADYMAGWKASPLGILAGTLSGALGFAALQAGKAAFGGGGGGGGRGGGRGGKPFGVKGGSIGPASKPTAKALLWKKLGKTIPGIATGFVMYDGMRAGLEAEADKVREATGNALFKGAIKVIGWIPSLVGGISDIAFGTDITGFIDDRLDATGKIMRGLFGSMFDGIDRFFSGKAKSPLESVVDMYNNTGNTSKKANIHRAQLSILNEDKTRNKAKMLSQMLPGSYSKPIGDVAPVEERTAIIIARLEEEQQTQLNIESGITSLVEIQQKAADDAAEQAKELRDKIKNSDSSEAKRLISAMFSH